MNVSVWWKSLVMATAAALLAGPASADEYPSRPIHLIVNFNPGGTTDLSARILGDKLSEKLKVPVTVENRGGGGGSTGVRVVATSDPDGYTIGTITGSPVTTLYYTQKGMGFHPLNDLTYLVQYATAHHPISVRADSPFKTFADLLDYARKNPGKLRYATAGALNQAHLAMEQLAMHEKIRMTFVPYSEGGSAAMTALLGGHIDMVVVSDYASPLKARKIRLLAETGDTPITGHQEVPTFKSLGYDFGSVALVGIVAPKGLPGAERAILEKALGEVVRDPDFVEKLTKLSMISSPKASGDFTAYATRAFKSTGEILKAIQGK